MGRIPTILWVRRLLFTNSSMNAKLTEHFPPLLNRKSVLIDPRFGPAWLAYAHSFAFEGEHDQAITAYSTAHRHLSGSHLPLLFIGMQHLGLSNVLLAEEYLLAAKELCKEDPLVLNELGVVCVHNEESALSSPLAFGRCKLTLDLDLAGMNERFNSSTRHSFSLETFKARNLPGRRHTSISDTRIESYSKLVSSLSNFTSEEC